MRRIRIAGDQALRFVRLRFIKQAGEEIVPDLEFGRMEQEMVAQFGKEQRQAPDAMDKLLAADPLEHKPYGQVVGHRDRHRRIVATPGTGSAAASITPQEHAGPARKFEGQTFEIVPQCASSGPRCISSRSIVSSGSSGGRAISSRAASHSSSSQPMSAAALARQAA